MSLNSASDNRTQVLQATDIVELIGQSVALKRRGKDFVGLCPFHQEKTPSFHVSPTKQFFHCYGCKAGGNAIDFVIKRDRVEFIDALRVLAERAGIELTRGGGDRQKASERQLLFDAQSAACGFFENWLNQADTGKPARDYLAARGFTPETIKQFRIGLAVDAWDALLKSPAMRKFPPPLLASAGLLKPRQTGDGFYDTFRNRVMFPIFEEAQARIIAFGGRIMPGSQDPAKYLNSPETPLFSKSRSIYGLNFARQRMIESGTAVIVEGYTDVVMAHQYGVTNAVSILGTALTEQHVNLLKRFAKKVVLLFDPDVAGDLAVDRALQFFVTNQIEIGVATLPDGVDPDEYLIAHGAAGFEQVVSNAVDVMSFKWKRLEERRRSADGVTDLESAVQEYMAPFDQARAFGGLDPIRWGFLLTRISRLTGLGVDELNRRFSIRKTLNKVAKPAEAAEQAPATPVAPTPAIKIPMAQELAERQMLGILLNEPNRWHKIGQFVHPEDFADPGRRKLAEIYWQHQQDVGEPVFREFVGELTDPVIKELAIELIGLVEETQEVEETLRGALGFLQEEKRRREEQKQLADLRRISQQSAGPEAEAKWAEFVKNNQTLDLRRLGPIRRFKSGS